MARETSSTSPELSSAERDLQAMAILERFAEEYRAGRNPRLADYLQAYPDFAGSLSEFVAHLLDEGDEAEVDSAPAPLSSGSRRALDAIFREPGGQPAARYVAESPAKYTASGEESHESSEGDK